MAHDPENVTEAKTHHKLTNKRKITCLHNNQPRPILVEQEVCCYEFQLMNDSA